MIESKRKGMTYFGAGLLAALLIGGIDRITSNDYEQAVADAALYCDMVAQGAWPNEPGRGCPSSHTVSPMDVAEVPDMPQEIDQRIARR